MTFGYQHTFLLARVAFSSLPQGRASCVLNAFANLDILGDVDGLVPASALDAHDPPDAPPFGKASACSREGVLL